MRPADQPSQWLKSPLHCHVQRTMATEASLPTRVCCHRTQRAEACKLLWLTETDRSWRRYKHLFSAVSWQYQTLYMQKSTKYGVFLRCSHSVLMAFRCSSTFQQLNSKVETMTHAPQDLFNQHWSLVKLSKLSEKWKKRLFVATFQNT